MEKNLVKKPERLDDLKEMDKFIYYMSIDNRIFKNRSMKFFDLTSEKKELYDKVAIPDDQIICDNCNWNIALDKPEKIPLLMEIADRTGNAMIKKAVCQKCVDKYYPKLICIGKPSE